MTMSTALILKRRPQGLFDEADFEKEVEQLPEPGEGEVLIRTVYVSMDASLRVWASEAPSYWPPVELGTVMRGLCVGVVEKSESKDWKVGDIGTGLWGFRSHVQFKGDGSDVAMFGISKVSAMPGVSLDMYLGLLGITGMTAYFGMLDVAKVKQGDTVVVSAAAGATGSAACQIAKIMGCRVVGTAGSDEKCELLTKELGCDAAINYKTADLDKSLAEACPNGVDVYFECTGGPVTDAVFKLLNMNARVAMCGVISGYTDESIQGPKNWEQVVFKRVLLQGFIVTDFFPRFGEGITQCAQWLAEGKLKKQSLDITQGLDNATKAINKLYDGSGAGGKMLLEVSAPPA